MSPDRKHYEILVVDGNAGDLLLLEEYLEEGFRSATIYSASSRAEAEVLLSDPNFTPDVVLVDITLNGNDYEDWVNHIIHLAEPAPVMLLTGYTHVQICISMLAQGASDYLVKDELDEKIIAKSIIFNMERKSFVNRIRDSEKRYRDLFHLSPQPMWVIDYKTLRFLDVNKAAVNNYGYSRAEFLKMSVRDIRPDDDAHSTDEELRSDFDPEDHNVLFNTRHRRKNGDVIFVEVKSSRLTEGPAEARLVLASDVTDRHAYISAIEKQNQKLRDIAWVQSHVVRAPLARLLGIVQMIDEEEEASPQTRKLLKLIQSSAHELDGVIHDVAKKAELINLGND